MINIKNKRSHNILIIVFEISIGICMYFVIESYNGKVEKFLLALIFIIFIFINFYIGIYLEKRDMILAALQKRLASQNHINNTIFNLQKAIIVVSNNISMQQANNTFFKTFDFKDIDDFSSKHSCICDLFQEKENVPHILPIMEGMNWSEYIIKHPELQHDAYMIDKDGNERIYSIDIKENIFGSNSMIVFTEITELKNQMETFHNLFANSVDGLLILQDNHYIDVNKRLLSMIDCPSKEEFLNLTPISLLPKYQPNGQLSRSLHEEMVKECLEVGSSSRERLQKKLLGEEFWCEVAMTKISLNGRDTIYVRWRDIHNYKLLQFSLEEQVEKQSQALITGSRLAAIGEMMENITHQWKQPLSVILNLVNILKLEFPTNKELTIISEQTKYLNNTIADFKNFSASSEDEKRFFNLNKSIETTLKIFQFQIETHNINIETKLEENITIKGDIGKFNQALLVILSNAKDAFLENRIESKSIILRTWQTDQEIFLTIEDNGGGIPSKIIDKIFEPYFTTKFKDKGTGIGLSMTHNIIQQIKGSIEVENSKNGAIFKIILPKN